MGFPTTKGYGIFVSAESRLSLNSVLGDVRVVASSFESINNDF